MQPEDFDRIEIMRYLGAKAFDTQLSAQLEECISLLCKTMQPRRIYRVFPIQWHDSVPYLEALPLEGADIAMHLSGCEQAALISVTLSSAVDALIRRFQTQNMAKAVMLDAAAGAAVEFVCQQVEKEILANANFPYHTERFSAGYGDFPLTAQKGILALLNAQRTIGLTVTNSNLLLPMKSVTAIIGLSHHPTKDARRFGCGKSCAECPHIKNCAYQK